MPTRAVRTSTNAPGALAGGAPRTTAGAAVAFLVTGRTARAASPAGRTTGARHGACCCRDWPGLQPCIIGLAAVASPPAVAPSGSWSTGSNDLGGASGGDTAVCVLWAALFALVSSRAANVSRQTRRFTRCSARWLAAIRFMIAFSSRRAARCAGEPENPCSSLR